MSHRLYNLETKFKTHLADTVTPVTCYLRLRDYFPNALLLESTDYTSSEQSFSYICCDPIAEFKVQHECIEIRYPDLQTSRFTVESRNQVLGSFKEFIRSFKWTESEHKNMPNGLFGYTAFDCIRYFEDLDIQEETDTERDMPDMLYHLYRWVIGIDHFQNKMFIMQNHCSDCGPGTTKMDELSYLIQHKDYPIYPYETLGKENSNFEDEEYVKVIEKCKTHIHRGDVFQIVPSRRFATSFRGDDFNVYRALRSINPSPYLFYFDYGSFKIFGSSPEAHLVVQNRTATLFPIAGTYRRTGDSKIDNLAMKKLVDDPKENAEHVMLVDLARNDLSKHCDQVKVETYKEIQIYSHVIHLTSRVSGTLQEKASAVDVFADTFPMGTLSGAPKYRALQLINEMERGRRKAYGGAIGFFGFDGSCNHAIVIRSFVSKNNTLYRQAGGGIVADSNPEDELMEVKNKLGALKAALQLAQEIGK